MRDFFVSYIETSFRIADPATAAERRRLLLRTDVLAPEPLIEPVLRYRSSERVLEQLIGTDVLRPLNREAQRAFVELALSGLFEGEPSRGELRRKSAYAPYTHQVEMLARGIQPGQPSIVTSGTGSGKTESFMLPILASLAGEAVNWPVPDTDYLSNAWWREGKQFKESKRQRAGERRPAAVRALILYPMNALVADQMVRLRKALDSNDARETMDERFAGNRIFFGNYTGETPVTGYIRHPRLSEKEFEKKRRARRISKLREAMARADEDQRAAQEHDARMRKDAREQTRRPPEPTSFIFPSLDGGEMLSRWDMQDAPPDILVTNASMLGAMLSREVENPIFDKTRDWIAGDPDAYFYLVVDELHLVRGSAGTEVSFLVKSLLMRLGLDQPQHRHKLRILASSASLPMDGERGEQSRRYLRDLFAPFGTFASQEDGGELATEFWGRCVVPGDPDVPPPLDRKLPTEPFISLLKAAGKPEDLIAGFPATQSTEQAVRGVAEVLGVPGNANVGALADAVASKAAAVLAAACSTEGQARATSVSDIAKLVFGTSDADALRGLMLARAIPDSGVWGVRAPGGAPSFRVHTFIRNVEGLFGAPIQSSENKVCFSDLTIIRGVSHGEPQEDGSKGRRLFEMLYCEACGDLFIGGQRGQPAGTAQEFELLPSAADLESAPDRGAPELYDKMTFEQFAVFWPSDAEVAPYENTWDQWQPATLDTVTGVVSTKATTERPSLLSGKIYFQTHEALNANGKKTAQPFCCPRCGTDYSTRPASIRTRSPIRAFRTGFTKASQLVATELFELLHAIRAEPKSIVFSDSRQDAANQALEIERLHLRDLRREIFVTAAIRLLEATQAKQVTDPEKKKIIDEYMAKSDLAGLQAIMAEWQKAEDVNVVNVATRKVRIDRLLQYRESDGSSESPLSYVASEFVRLGVHPFDELGRRTFDDMSWHDAFALEQGRASFSNHLTSVQRARLSTMILEAQSELVEDVVFSNTFFALEETGLGYPSLVADSGPDADVLDAWLRVFAGAYRVEENKYFDASKIRQWTDFSHVRPRNRVRRFAVEVFGEERAPASFNQLLQSLDKLGHQNGIVSVGKLFIRLSEEGDTFWRCGSCERVHLHRGPGICTRCRRELAEQPSGKVEDLWNHNFLGKRIIRSQRDAVSRFGLRCEELTGQTDDFSDRLRRFKDILVGSSDKPPTELQKAASEIDLLSVTTTMEVGIDIGALQTVLQANMPPQRFNYQQRVGRAGRRGQAFSFVTTFCRGRSHDEYYFRNPRSITGDPPPPPFLAVDHLPIPQRLLRKVWLRAAFARLREECSRIGQPYPGDDLTPPDVHGEYVPTDVFYAEGSEWPSRLHSALADTRQIMEAFVQSAVLSPQHRELLLQAAQPDAVLREIMQFAEDRPPGRAGLAQFLAERGLLPMYGMPTRVRQLYTGLAPVSGRGPIAQRDFEWSTMDRDVELAVFEYAPGALLTKDKLKHRVIGFTAALPEPERRGPHVIELGAPLGPWATDEAFVARCPTCGSASYRQQAPDEPVSCEDCLEEVPPGEYSRYLTPAAFRTDFRPEGNNVDDVGAMSTRTVATVLHEGESVDCGPLRIWSGAGITVMHLNDGPEGENGPERFTVDVATDTWVLKNFKAVRATSLPDQAVNVELSLTQENTRWQDRAAHGGPFGLMARKETDALYLELRDFDPGLRLDQVAKQGAARSATAARAAAISATHLLVQKAALALDVAPDEFEALEPRRRAGRPMLQIADALINGSGLCRRLGERGSDGRPEIVHLVDRILSVDEEWPLGAFLADEHRHHCRTSCYRCIQQYGNRRVHSLLDWRLAVAYLRAMITPGFRCGLDNSFAEYPELAGWRERSHELAASVAAMRPGTLKVEIVGPMRLACIVEGAGPAAFRMNVVHPLWRTDDEAARRLLGHRPSTADRFVDTFDLERRPLRALEIARIRETNPVLEPV